MSVTLSTWHFATARHQSHNENVSATREATIEVSAAAWLDPATRLLTFDQLIHGAEDRLGPGFTLAIQGDADAAQRTTDQLALRYQRLFTQRNAWSEHERFDRLLASHAALHDRTKPLVRADHDHALDVWQWVLRLAPDASEALQIAALFHDIERLASEADARVEQHAGDYLAFKQAHAARGARMMLAALSPLDVPYPVQERAARLVARHEQPEDDPELGLLNDADALSFFALNSPGFLAYFGPEHTHKKVDYTLRRMRSDEAREALLRVRLEPEIERMIDALKPAAWS